MLARNWQLLPSCAHLQSATCQLSESSLWTPLHSQYLHPWSSVFRICQVQIGSKVPTKYLEIVWKSSENNLQRRHITAGHHSSESLRTRVDSLQKISKLSDSSFLTLYCATTGPTQFYHFHFAQCHSVTTCSKSRQKYVALQKTAMHARNNAIWNGCCTLGYVDQVGIGNLWAGLC